MAKKKCRGKKRPARKDKKLLALQLPLKFTLMGYPVTLKSYVGDVVREGSSGASFLDDNKIEIYLDPKLDANGALRVFLHEVMESLTVLHCCNVKDWHGSVKIIMTHEEFQQIMDEFTGIIGQYFITEKNFR